MKGFWKGIGRREIFKLALGMVIILFFPFTPRGSRNDGNGASPDMTVFLSPAPWGTFFHTRGHHIVADSTGEEVFFRGVNLNGLEYGAFDDSYPPKETEGIDYFRPRLGDFDAVKALGFNLIRVPFEWARLVPDWQPGRSLPTKLDSTYLEILKGVVIRAAERQVYVILDMHDFLKYWSGPSSDPPAEQCVAPSSDHRRLLARTWKLLATYFRTERAVLGYDIMNEPVRREMMESCGSCNWHAIAQSVVSAIRAVDEKHLIFVEGPNYSLASGWPVENTKAPFITDGVTPPRIVYSPHVFFDFNNDSRYDKPGEETGPVGEWQYYVRDRLIPVIDWSIRNKVPIFIGETNVPCTEGWALVLEHVFTNFFDPLRLSVTAWHYINPARCPLGEEGCPLNLPACPEKYQLNVLKLHPGGAYKATGSFIPTPADSLIYNGAGINPDDARVNPWDTGTGFFGGFTNEPNFCATGPVFKGSCSLMVDFDPNSAAIKFIHHNGLNTSHFTTLRFQIFLTGEGQDFKIFTTAPRSDCNPGKDPVYPQDDEQPKMTDFLSMPMVGKWQRVEVPLSAIVDPEESVISGIAFRNMGMDQGVFYLDDVRLIP